MQYNLLDGCRVSTDRHSRYRCRSPLRIGCRKIAMVLDIQRACRELSTCGEIANDRDGIDGSVGCFGLCDLDHRILLARIEHLLERGDFLRQRHRTGGPPYMGCLIVEKGSQIAHEF